MAKPQPFTWTGTVEALRKQLNTPAGREWVSVTRTKGPIKIWCPFDRDAIVKIAVSVQKPVLAPVEELIL